MSKTAVLSLTLVIGAAVAFSPGNQLVGTSQSNPILRSAARPPQMAIAADDFGQFDVAKPFGWSSIFAAAPEKPIQKASHTRQKPTGVCVRTQSINAKRLRWYNTSIDKHGRAGRADEALQLLQDMITACVEPEDVTLLIAALACIAAGRLGPALSLLEIAAERGFTTDNVEVYSNALSEAARKQDLRALAFLSEDVRREVIYPHELRGIETEWQQTGKGKWAPF